MGVIFHLLKDTWKTECVRVRDRDRQIDLGVSRVRVELKGKSDTAVIGKTRSY